MMALGVDRSLFVKVNVKANTLNSLSVVRYIFVFLRVLIAVNWERKGVNTAEFLLAGVNSQSILRCLFVFVRVLIVLNWKAGKSRQNYRVFARGQKYV